jgi:hypothetical protein
MSWRVNSLGHCDGYASTSRKHERKRTSGSLVWSRFVNNSDDRSDANRNAADPTESVRSRHVTSFSACTTTELRPSAGMTVHVSSRPTSSQWRRPSPVVIGRMSTYLMYERADSWSGSWRGRSLAAN